MSDFDLDLEVAGGDELWTPPAQPTKAVVRVELDENGQHMIKPPREYTKGKNVGKKWIRVPFKVIGGEYNNYRATMFLTLDGKNPFFRKTFQVVTGIDMETLNAGNTRMSLPDFIDQLVSGTFEAIIQQQMDWDPATQTRVPSNYTEVGRLIRKLDDAEVPAAADDEPFTSSEDDDPDMPF